MITHPPIAIFPLTINADGLSVTELTSWWGSVCVNLGLSSIFLQLVIMSFCDWFTGEVVVISFRDFKQWKPVAIISNSLQFASALKGIRLRKLLFLYISGSVRCHFQVLRSSWYLQMCTCKLSLSYLSWENMQIWNLRFPAFVAPYKRAEFATFASAGNSRKALLPRQLKVTSSEEVQSIRDGSNFAILSQFNVR